MDTETKRSGQHRSLAEAEVQLVTELDHFTEIYARSEVGRKRLGLSVLADARGNREAAARRLEEAHALFVVLLVLRYVARGVLTLVHATGAGAASRQAIGTAVFYGMVGSTFLGLIFTRVLYVVITAVAERIRKPKKLAAADVVVELPSPVLSATT